MARTRQAVIPVHGKKLSRAKDFLEQSLAHEARFHYVEGQLAQCPRWRVFARYGLRRARCEALSGYYEAVRAARDIANGRRDL